MGNREWGMVKSGNNEWGNVTVMAPHAYASEKWNDGSGILATAN